MSSSLPLILTSTTVSDIGYVRHDNQDSSFAGEHLITVCDGMGGHAGGDTASTIAIRSLAHIEVASGSDPDDMARVLQTSIIAAHDAIVGKASRERKLSGMGTTVEALRLVGNYWVLAHMGDSRAYLLRGGELIRGTKDHSYVQHLIDTGRITPEQAKGHPQRNVVMRVLGDFDIDPHPDISIRTALPGDRWLLCSDGLFGVLEDSTIREALSTIEDPNQCAQDLVSMALRAGSTDNVTAAIADVTVVSSEKDVSSAHQIPLVGGAASKEPQPLADIIDRPVAIAPALKESPESPASRAAALTHSSKSSGSRSESTSADNSGGPRTDSGSIRQIAMPQRTLDGNAVPETSEIPIVQKANGSFSDDPHDPAVVKAARDQSQSAQQRTHRRSAMRRVLTFFTILVVLAGIAFGGLRAYQWSQTRYYIGESDGVVAIYRGVPTNIFGISLSHVEEKTDIRVSRLSPVWQQQLRQGIVTDSLGAARQHIHANIQNAASETGDTGTDTSTASPDAASDTPSGTAEAN